MRYFGFDPLPKTIFAFGPHGDLYEAQTDSLIIHVFNRNGQKIKDITAVCATPLITDTELDSVAQKAPAGYKNVFYNAFDQNKIHGRRWPAMLKFLVDERGRCWVKLYKHGTTKPTWWVFDTNGKARWKFTLSGNLELCAVRKDEVYCVKNEKGDFPGIVRYHVEGL